MEYLNALLYRNILNEINNIYENTKYEKSYGGLDFFRIKDMLDCFSYGQYESKIWAVNSLNTIVEIMKAEGNAPDEYYVLGGWYGFLPLLLAEQGFKKPIKSIDLDPICKLLGERLIQKKNISFITQDALTILDDNNHNNRSKVLICTACEHINQQDLNNLLKKKNPDMLVCLQSNNYFDINSHVNCHESLRDFLVSLPLEIIFSSQEKPWKDEYTRFMVIGK